MSTKATIQKAKTFSQLMLKGEDRDKAFKRLAKLWHPDVNPAVGPEVFAHISELYEAGEPKEIQIGKWIIREPLASGDIADLHWTTDNHILKIAHTARDNDLMDAERLALTEICKDDHYRLYVPEVKDAFLASGRRVNVLQAVETGISLEDIIKRVPDLDFRHVVWMMNRALSILGYVHRVGFVHGAVLPCHLIYQPAIHGLQLVDWCYSTKIGQPLKAMDSNYTRPYAMELKAKQPTSAGSDIYALACSLDLTANIPKRFRNIVEWMTAINPAARPQDAWHVQDIWRIAAREEYGDPKFLELTIPK